MKRTVRGGRPDDGCVDDDEAVGTVDDVFICNRSGGTGDDEVEAMLIRLVEHHHVKLACE